MGGDGALTLGKFERKRFQLSCYTYRRSYRSSSQLSYLHWGAEKVHGNTLRRLSHTSCSAWGPIRHQVISLTYTGKETGFASKKSIFLSKVMQNFQNISFLSSFAKRKQRHRYPGLTAIQYSWKFRKTQNEIETRKLFFSLTCGVSFLFRAWL